MDIKTKYHYTYFFNPVVIENTKYEKFLLKLIKDEKWNFRMYDKVVDMEIYTHFLAQAKKVMFPSFYWSNDYKDALNNMSNEKMASEFAKMSCVEFYYNINDNFKVQGKIDQANQIFFEISEIKMICFNTGICFLAFKTNIESKDTIPFRDLLNFNFKFKQISSNYAKYKATDNIYIQTNQFDNLDTMLNFINSITDGYVKYSNDDLYSDKMFVYSYACIDQSDWNQERTFEDIKDNFYKYAFQLSGDYTSKMQLNDQEYNEVVYSKWEYSKYGFSKLGGVLFASASNTFNYTYLPVQYEKVSMYIMLLAFYKRIALLVLDYKLTYGNKEAFKFVQNSMNDEIINNHFNQISNSSNGMSLWNKWSSVFELNELHRQVDKKYNRWLDLIKTKRMYMFLASIIFILLLILGIDVTGLI